MNFLLKNLELHIDEDFLILGERLVINNMVSDLREADKHLWVALVLEKEVEIQITPSKVKAYSCECTTFQKENCCEHLTAVLLTLRKHLADLKARKAFKRSKSVAPKKLTINTIFENAKKEDLIAFMRHYAKGNRQFSLALKARFAGTVPMDSAYDKYIQLLDSIINSVRGKNDIFPYKGSLEVLKVAKELLGQSKDAIALNDYSEGFVLLQCLIKKITPIIQKTGKVEEKFKPILLSCFLNIEKILSLNPAPGLIEEIRQFAYEECNRNTYQLNNCSIHFFEMLLNLSKEKKHLQKTLEAIDFQLNKTFIDPVQQAHYVIIKLKLLEKFNKKRAHHNLVKEYLNNPTILLEVIRKTIKGGNLVEAENLAEKGLNQGFSMKVVLELEELMYRIAVQNQDRLKIKTLAEKRFLSTLNYNYLEKSKPYIQEDWDEFLETIIQKVKGLPYSILKRDVLAEILFKESRLAELLTLITGLRSLDLLKKYDEILMKQFKGEIYKVYESYLTDYLKNHLGRKPSEKVREILNHIYEIGEFGLAEKLVRLIRNQYPERHSLMEELELFN